jgi:hypothetical protein
LCREALSNHLPSHPSVFTSGGSDVSSSSNGYEMLDL